MTFILRIFSGLAGALIGAIVSLLLQLLIGGGIHFIPISALLTPLVTGAALGFFVGVIFYKAVGRLFSFLGRFGIEASP